LMASSFASVLYLPTDSRPKSGGSNRLRAKQLFRAFESQCIPEQLFG
jgi:hypothetical protein